MYLYRGRWGQALELCNEALDLCRAYGSRVEVASAERVLAQVLTQVGAYEEAGERLHAAMTVFADAGWRKDLAAGFWIAGEGLVSLARYEQATERYYQALSLGRETHTVEVVICAQLGLAKLAAVRKDWHEVQRLCTEARARARQASLGWLVTVSRLGLARAHSARGEWRRAQREATRALDGGYRLRCPYDTFRSLAVLGEVLQGLEQPERARRRFEEAYAASQHLAASVPERYARLFLDRPEVREVRERAGYGPATTEPALRVSPVTAAG
jgi:tetratricopeptide (TPR) repeat protein